MSLFIARRAVHLRLCCINRLFQPPVPHQSPVFSRQRCTLRMVYLIGKCVADFRQRMINPALPQSPGRWTAPAPECTGCYQELLCQCWLKVSLTIFSPHRASAHRLRRYRTSTPAPVAWYGGCQLLPTAAFMLTAVLHCLLFGVELVRRSSSLFHNLRPDSVLRSCDSTNARNASRAWQGYSTNSLAKPSVSTFCAWWRPAAPALRCCKIGVVRLGFIRQLIQPALPCRVNQVSARHD